MPWIFSDVYRWDCHRKLLYYHESINCKGTFTEPPLVGIKLSGLVAYLIICTCIGFHSFSVSFTCSVLSSHGIILPNILVSQKPFLGRQRKTLALNSSSFKYGMCTTSIGIIWQCVRTARSIESQYVYHWGATCSLKLEKNCLQIQML